MNSSDLKNNSIKGVWFFGLSGSGKTTSANYLKKSIFINALLLDGDLIRKHVSTDLGYNIEDRLIQLNRIFGMCKICVASNVFPICSSVYMNQTMIDNLNKLGIKTIKIERDFGVLKKLKIYNLKENVFGLDLNYEKDIDVTIIKNKTKDNLFSNLKLFLSKFEYN